MLDIWSWICELPYSDEWTESNTPLILTLASSTTNQDHSSALEIQLRAERTVVPDSDVSVRFTVCTQGFHNPNTVQTLWVSDTCLLSSDKPFLPLLLQLLREIITRSPTAHDSTCPRSQLQTLKPEPISWIMDSHSPESFSSFFNLMFLTRLFWSCVCDAPSVVGSFYFNSILGPNIEALTRNNAPVLRTFLLTVGVDAELCFMRTLGYILAKWFILKEVGVGLQTLAPLPVRDRGFSYATEAHGFWILKGYAPVHAMRLSNCNSGKFPIIEAKESVLRYALAHQQLEAAIQMEYTVGFHEGYIQVNTRVDNLRFHVEKLGFNKNEEMEYAEERHFPSRVRVWVGPEVGSTYVAALSLGQSTSNGKREVEMQRILKGSYGNTKIPQPQVKARAKMTTKTKMKNWRWDQDVEGNAVVFDAVLCDNTTGQEIATWKDDNVGGFSSSFRNRYTGPNRPFTKSGGVVFAKDEYGEGAAWRLNREMKGSVLKWRIGGQIWLSYWPNNVKSSYFETRCVEWCDEVDLPLINTGT